MPANRSLRLPWKRLLFWLPALLLPETAWYAAGQPFTPEREVEMLLGAAGALLLANGLNLRRTAGDKISLNGLGLAATGVLVSIAASTTHAAPNLAALCGLWAVFGSLLALSNVLPRRVWLFLPGLGALALLAGGGMAGIAELNSKFADEEYFSALQAVILALWWGCLWLIWRFGGVRSALPAGGLELPGWALAAGMSVLTLAGLVTLVAGYQNSFYPQDAPGFAGITAETPILCGEVKPSANTYAPADVTARLTRLLEGKTDLSTQDKGLLALLTGKPEWQQAFRGALLAEAEGGNYTTPANSIKSTQYYAAQRLYFYLKVRKQYPNLFSPAEQGRLAAWYAGINRRVFTPEWVDLLYALAFRSLPEGPYLNQEIGAGLLSLLEAGGLGAPELSQRNRAFLQEHRFAWEKRSRVTDDALYYQPSWLSNAIYMQEYQQQNSPRLVRQSFEWMLAQALPDGGRNGYNPFQVSLLEGAVQGAVWLDDGRFTWLAGRSLDWLEQNGQTFQAAPLLEKGVTAESSAPDWGSCLVYGDSGLPYQVGPLAPDKVVLRAGWEQDSLYALLNLRFTGWHRYKATNAVVTVYQGEQLVGEMVDQSPSTWLPAGRAYFRDKRIPRENLNGLLVEAAGWQRLLYRLTGVGSRWAQDPPFYAVVKAFETGAGQDASTTVIEDWHGWRHSRTMTLFRQGPLVIYDHAEGSPGQRAAIAWHPLNARVLAENRISLGASGRAEMLLLPLDDARVSGLEPAAGGEPWQTVLVGGRGRVQLATVILPKALAGAEVKVEQDTLTIRAGTQEFRVELK